MAKCHNCGRETLRTEDWACQWCGHPLLYGSFKKIDKTYRQLKEERLNKTVREEKIIQEPEMEPEIEKEIEPKQDLEVIKRIKLEPESELEIENDVIQEMEKETVQEAEPEEKVEESEPEPVVEPEGEPSKAVEDKNETEVEPEEEIKPEPEVVEEPEVEEIHEIETEAELIKEPEPEPEPEPENADMELTVTEILVAYDEDDVAADEKFVNKILRVTGTVSMIDIKAKLDTHYIRLAGSGGDPWQSVQCIFDKKHSLALGQLEKGQTVTAQGRYSGSIIAIRMVDCVLVM
jgi:DNA-directed RNA polymerase subunit RPC12/RpoP